MSALVGMLVGKQYATLTQLDTELSYEDALKMAEIVQVQNYNDWAAMEAASRRR